MKRKDEKGYETCLTYNLKLLRRLKGISVFEVILPSGIVALTIGAIA